MNTAEKMAGLWPYIEIEKFRIVADYWAEVVYRDKPYPVKECSYIYQYEDGSMLKMERTGTSQVYYDIDIYAGDTSALINVDDRRER